MEQICSRCGSTTFHYNHSSLKIECAFCGTPLPDPQEERQLMQYDRAYAQAMAHLAAGNWGQTISLIKPLLTQYPTEKKLYVALLRAATQDFSDIDMANAANKAIASEAWDKLVRLNGVTAQMQRYSRQKYETRRDRLNKQKGKVLTWIFLAAFLFVVIGAFGGIMSSDITTICVIGLTVCLYKVYKAEPFSLLKRINNELEQNYQRNPFI